MPKLVNKQDNQLIEVPHTEAASAFLSGKYNLVAGQPVVMVDPQGALMEVAPDEVHKALTAGGYNFASPEAVQEADKQAKYGEGFSNEAASFGLGAANVLTFGAATPLLQGTGAVSQEALKEIPERNPISNVAGQVAGALVPIPGTAPSLIAKAGLGASEALLKALPAATSLSGRIAARAAAGAVGGAIEGALFEAGNQVSESTLGDPNFTAQRVAAHVGLSALFGGGLGTMLGVGSAIVPAAFSKAREGIERVYKGAGGPEAAEGAFVKAASFVSGKPADDIITALHNRGFDNSPAKVREFSEDLTKSLQNQYDTLGKASRETFKTVRPEESALLVSQADPVPIYDKLSQIDSTLQNAVADMRARPDIYPSRYASKLEDIAAGFTLDTVTGDSAEAGFRALADLKSSLDKKIRFGKIPSEESMDAVELIKNLRHSVKETLEDATVFGEAGARQAEFNNAFSDFKTTQDMFQKKFTLKKTTKTGAVTHYVDPVKVNVFLNQMDDVRGAGRSEILDDYLKASKNYLDQLETSHKNIPGKEFDKEAIQGLLERSSGVRTDFEEHAAVKRAFERLRRGSGPSNEVGAALAVQVAHATGVPYAVAAPVVGLYEILRNPGTSIQRLAKLESVVQKVSKAIGKSSADIFKAAPEFAARAVGEASTYLSEETFDKNVENVNNLANNVEALMPKLEQMSAQFSDYAPKVAIGLQQTAIRGIQFLQQKVPQAPATFPLQAKWKPGSSDIARFNRYYGVVQNPLTVYKQLKAGTLTHESLEALAVVYPDLHLDMQRAVIDAMTSNKKHMPYKTKVQLSLFLGQDLTASTSSASILSNQATLAGPPPQPVNAGGGGGLKSASKDSSSRYLTPMQQSAQRR